MKLWIRAPLGALCVAIFVFVIWAVVSSGGDSRFNTLPWTIGAVWAFGIVGLGTLAVFGFLLAVFEPLPNDAEKKEPSP